MKLLSSSCNSEDLLYSYTNFVTLLNQTEEKDFSKYLKALFIKNQNLYITKELPNDKPYAIISE